MHANNVLVPEQFGFREGVSTEDATFRLTDNMLKSLLTKKCMLKEFSVIWQKVM
jgi:hypothetical protein